MTLKPFGASDLLEISEYGANLPPISRALAILAVAFPSVPADRLAHLTIGQRDECLLALREQTFGSHLNGLAVCPVCSERLEMTFETTDLGGNPSRLPDLESDTVPEASGTVVSLPYEVTFRQPDSLDLKSVSGMEDSQAAGQQLLRSCLLKIRKNGQETSADDLPAEVLEAVLEGMTESDPLADMTLAVTCPACGHAWKILFDIASFFWNEISAWSARLLREVHILASAYGWRERDILSMSAWRRQRYLELVGA